jgi:hypothetical protein
MGVVSKQYDENLFFRWTGRGGGAYSKSKLKPITKWLQQLLIWLCGYSWDQIKAGAAAAAQLQPLLQIQLMMMTATMMT